MILGRSEGEIGRTVWEIMAAAGSDPGAVCGGRGRCGKCLVRLVGGSLAPPGREERDLLPPELRAGGWRLACRAEIAGPAEIAWDEADATPNPYSGPQRRVGLAPWARLPAGPRKNARPCGAAIDLGTTTVVVALVDLSDGGIIAARSAFNAQRAMGADVLSRVAAALQDPENRQTLQRLGLEQLRAMLAALLGEAGRDPADLVDLVVAGNPAMEHLLLNLDPSGLAGVPFSPAHQGPLSVSAADLGLPAHQEAQVYFPPILSGFIGADTLAGLVATDLAGSAGPALLMDLGTNGELVLAHRGRILACSTAAGPAFEGGEISCGMTARPGAIERVDLRDGDLFFKTIANAPARGICGSGLVDAVAVLRRAGLIGPSGRIEAEVETLPRLSARVRPGRPGREVFLASAMGVEITLTQGDVRQVQLAKGSLAAGVKMLCQAATLESTDLQRVLLAGAFGLHLAPESAAAIGLLPGIAGDRVEAVGNTALEGARLMLVQAACRAEAEEIAGRAQVVNLAADPEFQNIFADEMGFPE